MPVLDTSALIEHRVDAIRSFHGHLGIDRAQLDLSGGVDSAVMAGLLCLALSPTNLTVVYSSINSDESSRDRALALSRALGISLVLHDLSPTYKVMVGTMIENLVQSGRSRAEIEARVAADPTVLGSMRSCLRAPLGRGYLRLSGTGIRHGTGNECEDRWLRFYQKGGDGEVDTNPIAMLSKGEVFQLAHALGERLGAVGSYRRIISAAPSPELWGTDVTHTDEEEIGDYLGVDPLEHTFYSYVDLDKGVYERVGLIERVARFADHHPALFSDALDPGALDDLCATPHPAVSGIATPLVNSMLRAARSTEQRTRHKYNPNCPSLGTREDLLDAGILSNSLPSSLL